MQSSYERGEPWNATSARRAFQLVCVKVSHERTVLSGQVPGPPLAHLDELPAELGLVGSGKPSRKYASQLPITTGQSELAHALERLGRLRPDRDVAEAEDLVDAFLLDLREHGLQRGQVAVDVGDEREPHALSRRRGSARRFAPGCGRRRSDPRAAPPPSPRAPTERRPAVTRQRRGAFRRRAPGTRAPSRDLRCVSSSSRARPGGRRASPRRASRRRRRRAVELAPARRRAASRGRPGAAARA